MSFPMPRARRTIAAVGAVALLAACSPRTDEAPKPQAKAPATPYIVPPPNVVLPPPLGRADLLKALAQAADDAAAGRPVNADVAALSGRSFRLSLPFGCGGPPGRNDPLSYEWNEAQTTLKLKAAPQDWSRTPWIRRLAGDESTEAIEGFWLRRPWLTSDACPAPPPAAPPPAADAEPGVKAPASPPPAETIAIVQVFGAQDSRVARHSDRPYQATRKLTAEKAPGAQGYRLVLEGRLAANEARPAIACLSRNPDQRPLCVVQVKLDRVAFETPEGEQLAEWRG